MARLAARRQHRYPERDLRLSDSNGLSAQIRSIIERDGQAIAERITQHLKNEFKKDRKVTEEA